MINNTTPKRRGITLEELQQQVDSAEAVRKERGLTIDDLAKKSKIGDMAKQADVFAQKKLRDYTEEIKQNPTLGRGLSSANRFYQGLTEFVPAALKTKAILEAGIYNLFVGEEDEIPAEARPSYAQGQAIGKALEQIFPDNKVFRDEFWAGTMTKAAGQLTGNVVVSLASGGVGGAALASGGLNATLSSQTYEEAKANGADEDTAFGATILNMGGIAALEAIPAALFMKRIDQATGGGFKKVIQNGFKGSVEEGATEAVQTWYENLTAKSLYDETRNLMLGVGEAALAGALLGSTVNMALPAVMKKHHEAKTPEEQAAAKDAIAIFYDEYSDVADLPLTREQMDDFLDKTNKQQKEEGADVQETPEGVAVSSPQDISTKLKKKFKDIWIKYFRTGGVLGSGIVQRRELRDAAVDRQLEEAYINMARLNKRILEHYGSEAKTVAQAIEDNNDPVPADLSRVIDGALRNKAVLKQLPKELRGDVKQLRAHIDNLSKTFIKKGLVQGDLMATFMKNLGSYIHRSYKLYDPDAEWGKDTIPSDVWNSALVFMRNSIRSSTRQAGKNWSESKIKREAEARLKDILRSKDASSAYQIFNNTEVAVDKGDRSILLERQDIPKPIRELMGEYKDPAVNYINTINKMANFIERRKFLDEIADRFRGTMFLTEEEVNAREDWNDWTPNFNDGGIGSKLSAEGKNQLWMHKDVHDALTTKPQQDQQMWLTMLYRANGAAKYAKTAGSHVSHVRNLVGGLSFLGFQGHMFNPQTEGAFQRATSVFRSYENLSKKDLEATWKEYVELGLTGGSVRAGEFRDILSDMQYEIDGFMSKNFNHASATTKGAGAYKQSKSWFKKWSRKLSDLYAAEDAFLRTFMFELEYARMKKADPNITKQEVANIVNDLYPNYNRLNESLKMIRRFPFVAPFISFPAEVVRTSVNTVKRGTQEIQSDNPEIKSIGWKRLTGAGVTMSAGLGVGAASQALLRMDDEEEEAIRQFLPPWAQNSAVAYMDAKGGKVRYINTSYTNPYEFMIDPLFALIAGDSDREVMDRFVDSMSEMFSPILSEELFASSVGDIIYNQTDTGAEIWNPEDTLADKMQKAFLHMWDAFEPGTISSAERFFEPIVEEESEKQVSDELLGFFGLRVSTIDVKRSYGFRLRDFRQRIRDSRRVYNSVKYRDGATDDEKEEAFERSNARYEEVFNEMQQITDAAQETGVSWSELRSIMKDSGLANRDINGLRNGTFTPFER